MNAKTTEYIYKSTIKNTYGLTDSWIERIGEPDKIVPNPHYRSRKSYLFLRARVEAFIDEHQKEYEAFLVKGNQRRVKAQAVADRRIKELIEWAHDVELVIDRLPKHLNTLESEAERQFYSFRTFERDDYDTTFTMSYNALVAHVRHQYTNYEYLLIQIERKPGCHDAYIVIRNRCDDLIKAQLKEHYSIGQRE